MIARLTLAASALAVLLPTAAMAEVDEIREIDVTADLSAVKNDAAAQYWSTLETDLEGAIAMLVTDLIATEGSLEGRDATEDDGAVAQEGTRVLIDIRDVELTTAFERAMNLGDAVLVGQVTIVDQADNSNADGYELSVSLEAAGVIVPEGQTLVLNADDRVTYHLLIDAFAQAVVDRLK